MGGEPGDGAQCGEQRRARCARSGGAGETTVAGQHLERAAVVAAEERQVRGPLRYQVLSVQNQLRERVQRWWNTGAAQPWRGEHHAQVGEGAIIAGLRPAAGDMCGGPRRDRASLRVRRPRVLHGPAESGGGRREGRAARVAHRPVPPRSAPQHQQGGVRRRRGGSNAALGGGRGCVEFAYPRPGGTNEQEVRRPGPRPEDPESDAVL
mmetsp:Transcript_11500/g.27861  ORF Transcript_11500/g.27861 Transcript_11500/m.27861 type:complete len:208 (+) Transcript_11500:301-924(+)